MTASEILAIKVTKLGLTLTNDELALLVDEVEQVIKNYCNISTVPDELVYTVVNMSLDLAKYEAALYTPETDVDVDLDSVDSIKVGDTNISVKGGNTSSQRYKELNSHKLNLDSVLMNYKDQLNKFRRMVW